MNELKILWYRTMQAYHKMKIAKHKYKLMLLDEKIAKQIEESFHVKW